jgi:transcriptional regulator GlxA family with amidase domain
MAATDHSRRVVLFAPADVHSLEIAAVMDVFHEANTQRQDTLYELVVVAEHAGPIHASSGLAIMPHRSIGDGPLSADTFVVAGSYRIPRHVSKSVTDWIAACAGMARRYGAVCTGTFLLGAAGLIEGRRVTTHWHYAAELASRFPGAKLQADDIFVRDGRLFTSAGVSAAIDLSLALVQEDEGLPLALSIARHMVMYLKRPGGQSQYSASLAAQAVRPSSVSAALQWASENADRKLSVEVLAARAAMSPRNFSRRLARDFGLTPAQFVEQVRVERARRLLEDTRLSLEQVTHASGFGSLATARRAFLRRLGITMKQYRERFRLGPTRDEP